MCAVHLKIVARNTTLVPRDRARARAGLSWPDPETTQLSDEHLGHIWRLNGLGEFNREQWERQRSFTRWKINNQRAMDERDGIDRKKR